MKRFKKKEHLTEKEKVEERREEVLARGRKFKYPLQYAKHRLIFITIIIVILAFAAAVGLGYVALYKFGYTNDMLYRLTNAIPVPVAKIDDELVRYSDYLMIYRSTITPIEQQQGQFGNDANSDTMRAYYKRAALTEAEDYSYALKLARELDLFVSDNMVNNAIAEHRKAGGIERSEESFNQILNDSFNLSLNEYRRMVYLSLIKVEVSKAIDQPAEQALADVQSRLAASNYDLVKVANELADSDKIIYEETGGLVDHLNVDGGRASAAMNLQVGEVSEPFVSTNGDGYYIIKLIAKTDSEVSYASIKIPFTEFAARVSKVRADGKVTEYIELSEESAEQ